MARTTYRMCGGLAIMPARDMAMLKRMSAKGWHVTGINRALLYRFEQGEPHDYDYAVDYQRDFSLEAEELFRLGGWRSAVVGPGWQILRAEAGAVPLYTDDDAEAETLAASRKGLGWAALLCALAATLIFALEARFSARGEGLLSLACLVACVVFSAGFVFSLFPFIGYTRALHKIHAEQEADPRR